MSATFAVPGGRVVTLRIESRSGRVEVVAEPRDDVVVERGLARSVEGDDARFVLEVRGENGGSGRVDVRCPEGTNVIAGTASGRVELRGRFGAVKVGTASGRIEIGAATRADVRSLSGSIAISACDEGCRAMSKSGKVTIGSAGSAKVATISGRVVVGRVASQADVKTASGRVEVTTDGGDDVRIKTVTGPVEVRVPPGARPDARLRSLKSRTCCACETGDDFSIDVASLSGSIDVVPET
ncbi:MAG: hypothetical protein Kow0010_15480 [Dehalococcoidia bacterium]